MGLFFHCFLFNLAFPKKYCLSLTGVDISGKRKTSQTNKKPHQHKASKSISKKEKKPGGNCKGTIRNIHQSLDNTQTFFLFYFFFSFGLLCSFSSGVINKKSKGLTEEATKESDQLGGCLSARQRHLQCSTRAEEEKGKSWAKEPVLALHLQLTLQSLQITLSLPLHSQRAMYLYIPSLFFNRKKNK